MNIAINFIKKLEGKKLIILSLLALGILESAKSIIYFIFNKSIEWNFLGWNNVTKQLFFCLNLALPIYVLMVLAILIVLDKKILAIYYDKYHRIFLWVLILLIMLLTIIVYSYIFNQTIYTPQNFEQFRSSICLR